MLQMIKATATMIVLITMNLLSVIGRFIRSSVNNSAMPDTFCA